MKKLVLLALATSVSALTTLSAAPSIAALGIKNSASYSYPGFPNGAIAQGSIFVVFGSAMGPASIQYASSFPLPTTLGGTSINVTVNGTTLPCPMLYTVAGQLAAILPSTTPVGTGTMVVSFNGSASTSAPIKVATSSPGIFTVNQQGSGPAAITNNNGQQNALNFSFNPGQTVILWTTGLGPISGSDAGTPPTGNIPGVTVTVFVGGKAVTPAYAGRSGSAGQDQINVTLPTGVTGCYVPVYVVATPTNGAAVTSNFATVSIAPTGSACTDPNFPNISNGNGFRSGFVSLNRSASSLSFGGQSVSTTSDSGVASFSSYDPTYLSNIGSFSFTDITVGSCSVIQFNGGSINTPTLPKVLDAGPVINVNGPNGAKQLTKTAQSLGIYTATLAMQTSISIPGLPNTPLYLDPGNYTVDNGSGGADVGAFKLSLVVPPTFTWTNQAAITTIDRSQNLPITWTGGDPNATVTVTGSSIVDINANAFISFSCYAKDSDLQLTVPSAILSLLPASGSISGTPAGSLSVSTASAVTGTAPGLDILQGSVGFSFPKSGIAYK